MMKKDKSIRLRLPLSSFKIISCLILFFGCKDILSGDKDNSEYQSVKTYFKEHHQYDVGNKITSLFILTDNGCSSCNKKFSTLLLKYKDAPSSLFLITASGAQVDLSDLPKDKKNVLYDKWAAVEHELFIDSKVLFFKNNELDTIITIDAKAIDEQLKEINKRMNP